MKGLIKIVMKMLQKIGYEKVKTFETSDVCTAYINVACV